MEPLKKYKLIDGVMFNIYPGPLGLLCSGGTDSSLMLYNVLRISKDPVHVFTLGNNPLQNKNVTAVTRVLNKCIELTGNHNVMHHVVHQEGDKPNGPEPLGDMIKKVGVDIKVAMTGVTKNPPREILDTMNNDYSPRDTSRDTPIAEEELYDARPEGYPWVYTPWLTHDKKVLAQIYKKQELLTSLFPLTYSCEYHPRDKFLGDPGEEHCGKCWWCEERLWAFGRLK